MKIQTVLSATERSIFDTNAGLREGTGDQPSTGGRPRLVAVPNTPSPTAGEGVNGLAPDPARVNGTAARR